MAHLSIWRTNGECVVDKREVPYVREPESLFRRALAGYMGCPVEKVSHYKLMRDGALRWRLVSTTSAASFTFALEA